MESDRQQNGLSETYMDSDKPFCLLQDSHVYSTETGEMTQCQLLGYICQCCCGKPETSRKVTKVSSLLVFGCNEVIPSPLDVIWQWV